MGGGVIGCSCHDQLLIFYFFDFPLHREAQMEMNPQAMMHADIGMPRVMLAHETIDIINAGDWVRKLPDRNRPKAGTMEVSHILMFLKHGSLVPGGEML